MSPHIKGDIMFAEDKAEVKRMIDEAILEIKAPEVKAFNDSALKKEIAELKNEIKALKVVKYEKPLP